MSLPTVLDYAFPAGVDTELASAFPVNYGQYMVNVPARRLIVQDNEQAKDRANIDTTPLRAWEFELLGRPDLIGAYSVSENTD